MSVFSVVDSPPTTTERPQPRTTGDAAALAFRRRVQIKDRLARWLISTSGMLIICAVLGIGLFLFLEVLPLFQGARVQTASTTALPAGDPATLILVDEYQEHALVLGRDPAFRLVSLSAAGQPERALPIPELAGARVSAAAVLPDQRTVAIGTDQGVVWLGTVQLRTAFHGSARTTEPAIEAETVVSVAPGHAITRLAAQLEDGTGLIAALVDGTHVLCIRLTAHRPLIGAAQRTQESIALPLGDAGSPTAVLVHPSGRQVLIGTGRGDLLRWRVADGTAPELLERVRAVPDGGVSALAYLLGERSLAVGGEDGSLATWSLVRDERRPDGWRLAAIHPFPSHRGAVTLIAPSPRDKSFVTASADGTARLAFMTSERVLATMPLGSAAPRAGVIAPKSNGLLVADAGGALHHWLIHNPHPEVSWQALFGKIWYEGYDRPDYIWQSSGGTDDFEAKLSLVPLVFGTLKGTTYALLYAVPLALLGALYCSQFLEKRWRNPVKSTIELMAALPSVVLGFIAGVLLAPLAQDRIVSLLAAPVLVPLVTIAGMLLSQQLPTAAAKTFVRRHEFWVLLLWCVAGLGVAWWAGPWVERLAFAGDFEAWLLHATGTHYDQRNSLVVGWAMGFAVVPIIFTICEDAFSAVPRHLVGASLACGASLWQTAWRVVLPAAGSGVFSAIMVGFGRAVGETMIVLMATGNTPVLDWSVFNGFRALSANIAVEIPEAPYGGTLYRVLFIAALLLFLMTFAVNTVAELIRLRLRRRLQGV